MEGKLIDNVWLRRPDLKPIKTKRHKRYPNLFFELGEDDNGNIDIREITYPKHWSKDKIKSAVRSRSKKFKTEGCPHCKVTKKRLGRNGDNRGRRTRYKLLPGKRPIRDRIFD